MAALINDRNELLYSSSSRVTGASVSISAGVATSLVVPSGATSTVPSSIPLQANVSGYVAPSFAWSYRFGDTGAFTSIAGTTNTINFTCDAAFLTAAGTNTLVQFKVVVSETTGSLGVNQSEYTLALPILREGTDGTSGINSIVVILYKRTTTSAAPSFTAQDLAANSTYTFSTGQVVGQPSGWTQSIPSSAGGMYLWSTQVLAASVSASYAFANTQWSTPVLYSQDGASGTNTAIIYAYQRSATTLTSNPGAVDYSFSTNTITTAELANGWSKTIPSGSDPLYVTLATAASNGTSDSVLATEWTTPVQMVKDGANGINSATLYLYARNSNSSTAPTVNTTGSTTYTFTTGVISGTLPTGWTATIPAEANGTVIWVIQATAAANTTTDTIANTEWSTARVLGQQGADGAPGAMGTRGSRQLYSSGAYSATYVYLTNAAGAASYAVKATDLIAAAVAGSTPTTPIKGDTVTFSNNTAGSEYVYTITHDGTNWVTPGTVIDGSLLVTGTVTAAKINSNGLSIRDTAGNVILSAGNSLANSSLSLPGTVSNVPAGWQNSNISVGGRNLLLGSGSGTGWTYSSRSGTQFVSTAASTGESTYIYSPYFSMWGNQEITLSFDSKEDAIINSRDFFILPDNYASVGLLTSSFAKSANWVRYYFTFTTPAAWGTQTSPTSVRLRIDHNGSSSGASASIYARNIKLELGNKPTDWTPAPEDTVYVDLSNAPSAIKNDSISISAAGVLSGAGGGTVTPVGIGAIKTDASNAPTSVLNSNISISSGGVLTNAGGGTVTISGLGYSGALDANNTYLDASGNIQGVSSGGGTAVKNNNISISSAGSLSGAGGGTVTIGGLGYSGDLNATYGAQSGTNLKDSSGTVIKDDAFRNNLINVDWWKRDASIPWSPNDEYNRIISVNPSGGGDLTEAGPRGGNDLVWYCEEVNNTGNAGGGWNATISSTLDPSKTYRFAVAIRVGNNTGGSAYWGTNNVCDLNTTTYNGNPYFAVMNRNSMSTDRWYLFVGYVFPYGSTGNSSDSAGIWDCKTGAKVSGGTNYCHTSTGATGHRAYQYYAAQGATQRFSRPMINMVDGTEPSLREYFEANAVLNNAVSISSAGVLSGAGGGTVTISGLGYTGALNATYGADWATNVTGATAVNTAITSAQTTADLKLSKAGADTLTGPISLNAATAILVGDTTNGLYLGNTGIVGRKNGNTKFYIDQNGNAGFSGDISGATGTFSGTVSAGSIDVGKLSGQTQSFVSGSGSVTTVNDYSEVVLTINGAGGGGGGGGGRYIVYQGIYGGGASGGPGGAGGTYIKTVTGVANDTVINYSIGTGGTGGYSQGGTGAVGQAGTAGGNSTATILGTTYTAYGGGGGTGASGGGVAGTQGSAGAGGGTGSAGGALNGGYGGSGQSSAGTPMGSSGGPGGSGSVIIQMYNPNGVVRRDEWNTLVTHLTQRFGSYSWP